MMDNGCRMACATWSNPADHIFVGVIGMKHRLIALVAIVAFIR